MEYTESASGRPQNYKVNAVIWRKFKNVDSKRHDLADGGYVIREKVMTRAGLGQWNTAGYEVKQYDSTGALVSSKYTGQKATVRSFDNSFNPQRSDWTGDTDWAREEARESIKALKSTTLSEFQSTYGTQYENIGEYQQRVQALESTYDRETAERIAKGEIAESEAISVEDKQATEREEELDRALERARNAAVQQTEDATAQYIEQQQTNVARAAGRETMNMRNQLQAQGYSPAEIAQMSTGGVANVGRLVSDAAGQAGTMRANQLAQIYQQQGQEELSVADYGMRAGQFADQLRQQTAINQQNIQAQMYGIDQNTALQKWMLNTQLDAQPDPYIQALMGGAGALASGLGTGFGTTLAKEFMS